MAQWSFSVGECGDKAPPKRDSQSVMTLKLTCQLAFFPTDRSTKTTVPQFSIRDEKELAVSFREFQEDAEGIFRRNLSKLPCSVDPHSLDTCRLARSALSLATKAAALRVSLTAVTMMPWDDIECIRHYGVLLESATTVDEEERCAICLEGLGPRMPMAVRMSCSHLYHSRCIVRWLERNRTCPMCRTRIRVRPRNT